MRKRSSMMRAMHCLSGWTNEHSFDSKKAMQAVAASEKAAQDKEHDKAHVFNFVTETNRNILETRVCIFLQWMSVSLLRFPVSSHFLLPEADV